MKKLFFSDEHTQQVWGFIAKNSLTPTDANTHGAMNSVVGGVEGATVALSIDKEPGMVIARTVPGGVEILVPESIQLITDNKK